MKNLISYQKNAFDFHKRVITQKRNTTENPEFKKTVSTYNDDIETKYKEFEKEFVVNNLEALSNHGYDGEDRTTLHKLYSYRSKIFQRLKLELTTDENNRIDNTCQNCTIGEVNSFDHYLPKDKFAEFVVNPKNLIPSCSNCNGKKGAKWIDGGNRLFLNLYLDTLPTVQYLFVDIDIAGDEIALRYYLDNQNSIDENLFQLITVHYKSLNLFQRFAENSDSVISELENSIKAYFKRLPLDKIKKSIIEASEADMGMFGTNYWKSVLKIALVNNEDFMARVT